MNTNEDKISTPGDLASQTILISSSSKLAFKTTWRWPAQSAQPHRLFQPRDLSPVPFHPTEAGHQTTQLALPGFVQYPSSQGSPKDAVASRQQEAILRIQCPHSREVGWVVFVCSMGYKCLSLFRGSVTSRYWSRLGRKQSKGDQIQGSLSLLSPFSSTQCQEKRGRQDRKKRGVTRMIG